MSSTIAAGFVLTLCLSLLTGFPSCLYDRILYYIPSLVSDFRIDSVLALKSCQNPLILFDFPNSADHPSLPPYSRIKSCLSLSLFASSLVNI